MTKDKMIYDDAKTIGVDADSLNKLMDILTPRMQEQLVNELILVGVFTINDTLAVKSIPN